MPHTSHRKKVQRTKRAEVTDENGWTRVTTTNPTQRSPRPPRALTARDALEREEDENHKWNSWEPSTPVDGMTIEKLEKQYFDIEKKWLATESYKELAAVLESKSDRDIIRGIDQCVVFGTGSYCGDIDGWIERFDVSLYQLAAFVSVLNKIEHITGTRPKAFAQEPVYNDFDVQLLTKLNISRIDNPQGFKILTPNSLIYAPGAELMVELRVLAANPTIAIVSGKLDFYWRNDRGEACTDRTAVYVDGTLEDEEPKNIHDLTAEEEKKLSMPKEHYIDEFERGLSILEEFKKDRDCFQLPALDVQDHPFWNVHVYVRQAVDDGGQDVDGEVVDESSKL